jgi:predicted KAP-like P-loop ATPase
LVRRHPEYVCGLKIPDDSKTEILKFAEGVLAASLPHRQKIVEHALQEIFPRFQGIWNNHYFSGSFIRNFDKQKRACSERRFPTYFTFSISEDVFSEQELSILLSKLLHKDEFLPLIIDYLGTIRRSGSTKASLALDEIETHADLLPTNGLRGAAETLLWHGDRFINKADERGFFATSVLRRVLYTLKPILKKMEANERLSVLESALAESPSLALMGLLISDFSRQHGQYENEPPVSPEERDIDAAGLERLKEVARVRFESASKDGTLLVQPRLASILFVWRKLSSEEAVKEWTTEQIKTDNGALKIAASITGSVKVQADGPVVELPSVNRTEIEHLVDVDLLLSRLDSLRASLSDDKDALTIIENFEAGVRRDSEE